MKLLIIEDTEVDIIIAEKIIQNVNKNIQINSVDNVLEAIIYLENCDNLPDLILLDLILPVRDGFDFLKKALANPKFKNIPVYIYTSSIHFQDRQKATSYPNVKGYIDKPISQEDVIHFQNVLNNKAD